MRTTTAAPVPNPATTRLTAAAIGLSVAAAALGYFVDLFDIVIFGVVRVNSLIGLKLQGAEITDWGIRLLNLQMLGMLIGGFAWGYVGDRLGRRFALLSTIAVFSFANLANAYVGTVEQYAALRFLAGFGLAGELGAGVTLVSELMPKNRRGYGITLVSFLGLVGALTASYVGSHFEWRNAYFIGGSMGLVVLLLRFVGMAESEMFEKHDAPNGRQQVAILGWIAAPLIIALLWLMFGNGSALAQLGLPPVIVTVALLAAILAGLFTPQRSFITKFYAVTAVGVPIWFVSALFVNLAPEFGKALALTDFDPKTFVGQVLAWQASGLALGSALTGVFSEWVGSRKRVLWICLAGLAALVVVQSTLLHDAASYAHLMFGVGLFQGYWTAFIAMAAEQFGIDVRATVSSSIPNIVRAMTVPVTLSVRGLEPVAGWTHASLLVGAIVFVLALLGLSQLQETYGKNLDYAE